MLQTTGTVMQAAADCFVTEAADDFLKEIRASNSENIIFEAFFMSGWIIW